MTMKYFIITLSFATLFSALIIKNKSISAIKLGVLSFLLFSLPAWFQLWDAPSGFLYSIASLIIIWFCLFYLVIKKEFTDKSVCKLRTSLKLISIGFFLVLCAIICVLYQRTLWGYQIFHIPTDSMSPNLLPGDFVVVNMRIYKNSPIAKKDIVVFKMPDQHDFHYLIKRVEYVEGDRFQNRLLTATELAVLGDNRDESEDSRVFGTIQRQSVVGKAMWVIFSIDKNKHLVISRSGLKL